MKFLTEHNFARISALATVLVLGALGPQTLYSSSPEGQQKSQFLIQGQDVSRLVALVEHAGGTVTQELSVLKAVGVEVTPSQLRAISRSAEVHRILDDRQVAMNAASCLVHGDHLLEVSGNSLAWSVTNHGDTPATLESVSIAWPAALGNLNVAEYEGAKLADNAEDGSLALDATELKALGSKLTIDPGEKSVLRMEFDGAPIETVASQSDFDIALQYQGQCAVELVAGYADYQSDSYYPSVVNADELHRLGITGEGVTVAVIDSGLWLEPAGIAENTAGQSRVIATFDATAAATGKVTDQRGHGTHITSILANSEATGNGTSYKGIAPGVNIVAIKAFEEAEEGSYLNILRALQYVLDNRESLNIRVLNLSFGMEPEGPYWADPVNQLVMEAWRQGIFVVASAGNGVDLMSVNAPGNNPYIMTVGAATDAYTPTDRSDDYLADFSAAGPTREGFMKPEIVAPGGHMIGIAKRDSGLALQRPNSVLPNDRFMMSGTSQSTAVVSGIAALMLENDPSLTPDEIKCRMTDSATSIAEKGAGAGYVDAVAAVNSKASACANIGMNVAMELAGMGHYRGPLSGAIDGSLNADAVALSEGRDFQMVGNHWTSGNY